MLTRQGDLKTIATRTLWEPEWNKVNTVRKQSRTPVDKFAGDKPLGYVLLGTGRYNNLT